jgi:hypothetical protein
MTEYTKTSAKVAIGAGGSLVGLIAGWDMGPLTLELGSAYLAMVGAVGGGLFVLTCSCWATERAEALADRQRQIARLAKVTKQVRLMKAELRTITAK